VPKLYLRGFARGNTIAVHRRDTAAVIEAGLKRVAVESDFYGVTLRGHRDPTVEQWLAEVIDGPAAAALRCLREDQWPPTASERQVLASFLGFQLTRTPLIRKYLLAFSRHLAPMLWSSAYLRNLTARTGADLTFPEKVAVLRAAAQRTPPELLRPEDARSLLRTMTREGDRLAHLIGDRGWSLHTTGTAALLTSDNPVARFFPTGRPAAFTGLASDDAELHFPIDTCRLLVVEAHGRQGSDEPAGLTEELVAHANAAQLHGSDQAVFRHPDMPWPQDLQLTGDPPTVPTPLITLAPSTGPPTFPARYPTPHDPRVAELLSYLGAQEVVE